MGYTAVDSIQLDPGGYIMHREQGGQKNLNLHCQKQFVCWRPLTAQKPTREQCKSLFGSDYSFISSESEAKIFSMWQIKVFSSVQFDRIKVSNCDKSRWSGTLTCESVSPIVSFQRSAIQVSNKISFEAFFVFQISFSKSNNCFPRSNFVYRTVQASDEFWRTHRAPSIWWAFCSSSSSIHTCGTSLFRSLPLFAGLNFSISTNSRRDTVSLSHTKRAFLRPIRALVRTVRFWSVERSQFVRSYSVSSLFKSELEWRVSTGNFPVLPFTPIKRASFRFPF